MPSPTDRPDPEFLVPAKSPFTTPECYERYKQRSISAASRMSEASQSSAASAASEFLEGKIALMESEREYLHSIKLGIDEEAAARRLQDAAVQRQLAPIAAKLTTTKSTLTVLKRHQTLLAEDLEEAVEAKRQRSQQPLDMGIYNRAYMDTIIPRVMSASAKQRRVQFDHRKFKKEANQYYGITDRCAKGVSFCHVLGIHLQKENVKAAHIVPKSLTKEEVSHLFGIEDGVSSDPRNALFLCAPVELLLDQGIIAIVPVPGAMTTPTTWICVVLDDTDVERDVCAYDKTYKLKDLDGRRLKFLDDNRPRRRYLYFRFIISYLYTRKQGIEIAPSKVNARRFWPSGGAYLEKSTLQTLARCVSGRDLPDDLIDNMTFETPGDTVGHSENGMTVGATLDKEHQRVTGCPVDVTAITDSIKHL